MRAGRYAWVIVWVPFDTSNFCLQQKVIWHAVIKDANVRGGLNV